MLSFEEVDSLLSYNSETGILRWKVPRKGTKGVGSEAGCMNKKTGYIIIGLHGKIYYAHRIAHLLMTGFWPYMDPDHENRIRHDNRWENIRDLATKHESMGNQGLRGNNTSGLKGVSWYRSSQKWRVRIAIHWKHIHLGYFDDLRLAGLTYDAAAKLAWGLRFSCLNFPPEESDHIVLPSCVLERIGTS